MKTTNVIKILAIILLVSLTYLPQVLASQTYPQDTSEDILSEGISDPEYIAQQ